MIGRAGRSAATALGRSASMPRSRLGTETTHCRPGSGEMTRSLGELRPLSQEVASPFCNRPCYRQRGRAAIRRSISPSRRLVSAPPSRPTRRAARTAHSGAPGGRGSGSTQSMMSHITSETPAMREARRCLGFVAIADMSSFPSASGSNRLRMALAMVVRNRSPPIHSHIRHASGYPCRRSAQSTLE